MSDKRPDGQRERTFRTRKLLIEAYINVAGEKKRIPKTGEVALRAGVSQRSVFERFGSLDAMYRPELDTLSEPARIAVLIALEALTDWACWGRMREHYGHSFDQACKRVDRGDRAPAAADSRLLNRRDINRARPDAGGPVDHEALLQRNASATACTISSLP